MENFTDLKSLYKHLEDKAIDYKYSTQIAKLFQKFRDRKYKENRPNEAEKEFLTLAYCRFYDIYKEVMSDSFWKKDPWYRLSMVKEAFGIYAELLKYEPIKWVIEYFKKARPPMEAEIGSELFRFIRNILAHMPFFKKWDDIWINKNTVNWHREGQFIDKFLIKYEEHKPVKYRFWETKKKRMSYLSINFPNDYSKGGKIFLKDILVEKEGIKFSLALMKQILDTQVEEWVDEKSIK